VLLKPDLDVHKPTSSEAGLLNKSSSLAAALGVTKFITAIAMSHFVVLLKSDLDVYEPTSSEGSFLNKSSSLATALGVTKFVTVFAMYLVTLCCAT
jgi:hypothetical protein